MRNYNLFLMAICMIMISCSETSSVKMTESGYQYKMYNDSPTEVVQPGQYVYYYLDIFNDRDSLLQTTRKNPNQPITLVPLEDDASMPPNPIMDVIKLCSVGDSVGIILPKDSIPNLPPQFSDIKHIEYKLVITEAVDEATYKERADKERAAAEVIAQQLQAREGEVAELVGSLIKKYNSGQLDNELQTAEGDLKYLILEEGTGPLAENGTVALAQYYGSKLDGESFDNSFKRGRGYPVNVGAGGVIQGWDKAFPYFKEGTKAMIFIPSDLGYGEMGSPPNIGPNEDLVFYVEIEDVN